MFCILLLHRQQCESVTSPKCAAVFSQPYYKPVDGREESESLNFAMVAEISDQFCRNALLIYACYYAFPPCDNDTGADLLIDTYNLTVHQ